MVVVEASDVVQDVSRARLVPDVLPHLQRLVEMLQRRVVLAQYRFHLSDHFQAVGDASLQTQAALDFQRLLKALQRILRLVQHGVRHADGLQNLSLLFVVAEFDGHGLCAVQVIESGLRVV